LVEIRCVAPHLAHRIWPMVKRRLAEVFEEYDSDSSIEATEHDVVSGLQLLWLAMDGFEIVACATTALSQTPSKKLCTIVVASGVNTKLWDSFMPMVERYARAEGCSNLRLSGRDGWKRVLKDFRQPWIVLDKELT
jgi:hypothetical protein